MTKSWNNLLKGGGKIVESASKSILHNQYVLYFIFALALGDFVYLLNVRDLSFIAVFLLVGFLTSFFSKNMVVILCIAMSVTHVLKYGTDLSHSEGIDDTIEKEGEESDEESDEKKYDETDSVEAKDEKKEEKKESKSVKPDEKKKKSTKMDVIEEPATKEEQDKLNDQLSQLLKKADTLTESHSRIVEKMENFLPSGLTSLFKKSENFVNSAKELKKDEEKP